MKKQIVLAFLGCFLFAALTSFSTEARKNNSHAKVPSSAKQREFKRKQAETKRRNRANQQAAKRRSNRSNPHARVPSSAKQRAFKNKQASEKKARRLKAARQQKTKKRGR
jgi:hypothetical protein